MKTHDPIFVTVARVNDFGIFCPTVMRCLPEVNKIVFNPPLTIVQWKDDTETRVRCDNDEFSEEFGFAMACMRKIFGTRKAFKNQLKNAIRHVNKPKKPKKQKKSKTLMVVTEEMRRFNQMF